MSENNIGNLYAKIAKITGVLSGKLSKDQTNAQQRYDYISADQVLQEVGREMSAETVIVIPDVTAEATEEMKYTDQYGKEKTRYDSVVEFNMIVCDGSGNSFSAHWVGRGSDYSVPDKAYYKAVTSGHKYYLMKLFSIGAGNEDGEHEEPPRRPQPSRNDHDTGQPAVRKSSMNRAQREVAKPVNDVEDRHHPEGGNMMTVADIRATFDDLSKFTLGMVANRATMTGLYNANQHALNAMKEYGFPDGVSVKMSQVVTKDGALKVFDWLVDRKTGKSDK